MIPVSLRLCLSLAILWSVALAGLAACALPVPPAEACTDDDHVLQAGFYAFFFPVSYSADEDPEADAFNAHRGYEADLLTALEAMEGAGLSFARHGIAQWDDIWLQSAGPQYDIVGGGITILDTRTRNAANQEVVAFTAGHIAFRQSLLVRAEDAARLARYDSLTQEVKVGVLAGTTGEARLLQLTGLADADGVLRPGVRVETPQGSLTADGSRAYRITSAATTPNLAGRRHLYPPDATRPQVIYLGDEIGERELLAALADGTIDAVARGEIGNRGAASLGDDAFVVSVLDDAVEYGGFTLDIRDERLAACLDAKINYLTDNRRLGYAEWLQDADVFLQRARQWNASR